MKLGQFETTAEGAVRTAFTRAIGVGGGSITQEDLVEFVRALHDAHQRGEVVVCGDQKAKAARAVSDSAAAQRFARLVAEELHEIRGADAPACRPDIPLGWEQFDSARGPSTTGDSTHVPAQWPSTAFRECL